MSVCVSEGEENCLVFAPVAAEFQFCFSKLLVAFRAPWYISASSRLVLFPPIGVESQFA